MRFLADENLDFAVVRALRAAGHDVRALAEETSRTIDAEVIADHPWAAARPIPLTG